ncbi:MAG: class I SAM-dependent methyltransferase [Betaproteobacteria bacterium]|nr:class I SAM-dependent methyltransferase [Betaproteobacteria bacterium]
MFAPQPLAFKYCVGNGLELGASIHNPFCLPNCLNVAPSDGVNFLHLRDLEDYQLYVGEQGKYATNVAQVDKIGDFRRIPVETASLDFVISSHVIEHEPNPIAGFLESARVLKEGGIFFCIFPKRTAEQKYDIFRPLTQLKELILAYTEDRTVDKFPCLTDSGTGSNWRMHYCVYSLQSMLQLVNWINQQKLATFCVEAVEETDSKVGNGHTIVLRKMPSDITPEDDAFSLIERCILQQQYETGLLAAKISLSFDFFQPLILHAAALLSMQTGHPLEAREFYRQCLLQDPECEARRREFFELFGEFYTNPLR